MTATLFACVQCCPPADSLPVWAFWALIGGALLLWPVTPILACAFAEWEVRRRQRKRDRDRVRDRVRDTV